MVEGTYVEPTTGANFTTWTAEPNSNGDGGITLGIALPSDAAETDATEYIGYLVRLPLQYMNIANETPPELRKHQRRKDWLVRRRPRRHNG